MNYPGSGNFFGTRVPGTRLTSLLENVPKISICSD